MRVLIAAATSKEIAPFVATLGAPTGQGARLASYSHPAHQVDVLITGVGMVATATWCSRSLAKTRYDLALNLGVCGTFDRGIPLGEVVQVVSDRIAELGAEAGEAFLTVQEIGLLGIDEFPFSGGQLRNASPPQSAALSGLRSVAGITVNTVHGNMRTIAGVSALFKPDVESMEGAAFMYACLTHGIAFAQVRAVSNVVETRATAAWKLDEAIANLGRTALQILEQA